MSTDVDTYLANLPAPQRDALQNLRALIKSHFPDHIEVMSYAMPGFRQPGPKGKMIIGYAAFARHLGLYPHSGSIIPHIASTPYKTSRSGVLFTPQNPLPDALVLRIIALRQEELAAGYPH